MGIDRPGEPPDRPEHDPERGRGRRSEGDGRPPPETRSRAEYYESQRRADEARRQPDAEAGTVGADTDAAAARDDRARKDDHPRDGTPEDDRLRDRTPEDDRPRDSRANGDHRNLAADNGDGSRTGDRDESGDHREPLGARDAPGRGELPGGRTDGPRPPDGGVRNYWYEVPRFLREWQDLKERLPDRKAQAADSSGDPHGSWRGEGGQYLSPDQHEKSKQEITEVREAERGITADLRKVEAENTTGAKLAGLEFRLKGEERLKEKIAEKITGEGLTAGQAAGEINDAIRYTFRLDRDNYSRGYSEIKQRLEMRGYDIFYSKNHWDAVEYKGINTRWLTPEGQRFEIQFHTRESLHAKQEVTHEAYERARNPITTKAERLELKAFQQEVSSWVPVPSGARDIRNYLKEGCE